MPPGNVGKFDTGWSFWQLQLHYGGPEYPQYGTVAGMGNGFTKLTSWAPGDPRAWKDAARYALNRAKAGGWLPWYGAAAVGIGKWDGIDRAHQWNATSERWDYETGAGTVPKVAYNPAEPAIAQNDQWSCAPTSTRWALKAVGRNPSEPWIEQAMLAESVVSTDDGLLDASGRGLAAFVKRHYGEYGYDANHEPSVTFEAVAAEAGPYPLLIGGRRWGAAGHWSGVRGFDPATGLLQLANPSSGYGGIAQTMSKTQWNQSGPFSMVRVLHPDLLTAPPVEPPAPSRRDVLVREIRERLDELAALAS